MPLGGITSEHKNQAIQILAKRVNHENATASKYVLRKLNEATKKEHTKKTLNPQEKIQYKEFVKEYYSQEKIVADEAKKVAQQRHSFESKNATYIGRPCPRQFYAVAEITYFCQPVLRRRTTDRKKS